MSPRSNTLVSLVAGVSVLLAALPRAEPAQAATITVNSTADAVDGNPGDGVCADSAGRCTLRAAIMEANGSGGSPVITVPAGTYTLTLTGSDENNAATGDLDVKQSLTITGAGAGQTIIDGGSTTAGVTDPDRVFDIFSPASVTISNLTIQHGKPPFTADGGFGGGIRVGLNATLELDDVTLTHNATSGHLGGVGGGLFNQGSVVINHSQIINNSAESDGGGFANSVAMTVNHSLIDHNTSNQNGGGFQTYGGTTSLNNTPITNNHADDNGGGFRSKGDTTLHHSPLTGNTAQNGFGGGFRNEGGTVTIDHSPISNNAAQDGGGGEEAAGPLTLDHSPVTGNHAVGGAFRKGDGGGLNVPFDASVATVTKSPISENSATGPGGGVALGGGSLTLTDLPITANQAGQSGGGIAQLNSAATLTMTKVHISGNSPDQCSGTASCPP